jgi:hypothetical protein
MAPASLVAWRWESLKYAGTVITADLTLFDSPRYLQSVRVLVFSCVRTGFAQADIQHCSVSAPPAAALDEQPACTSYHQAR